MSQASDRADEADDRAGAATWRPTAGRWPTQAKAASRQMALARGAAKNAWLSRSAEALGARADEILEANARDVAAAPGARPERRGRSIA